MSATGRKVLSTAGQKAERTPFPWNSQQMDLIRRDYFYTPKVLGSLGFVFNYLPLIQILTQGMIIGVRVLRHPFIRWKVIKNKREVSGNMISCHGTLPTGDEWFFLVRGNHKGIWIRLPIFQRCLKVRTPLFLISIRKTGNLVSYKYLLKKSEKSLPVCWF
jgi:hypothetical protein